MSLRQAAQQALEALIPLANAASPNERECLTDEDHERAAEALEALCAALAEPDSDYERGFVDGMNLQTKGSVDKAVNRIAEPEQEPVECDCLAKNMPFGRCCKACANGIGEQHE